MLKFLIALTLPVIAYSAVQCFVGQKLFSYESTNAICAKFIPYNCTVHCEWRKQCNEHTTFSAFHGRRTFASGLLLNSKSLMVLCCGSLATRVETDKFGREKCIWRNTESIPVLGASVRTNPVLAPNHYIRDIKMERDGNSRVDVSMEVCQYVEERSTCNIEEMNDFEKKRFGIVKAKLDKFLDSLPTTTTPKPNAIKTEDEFLNRN